MIRYPISILISAVFLLSACGKSGSDGTSGASGKPGLDPASRYILSTSLSLRTKPSLRAAKLGLLRYGQTVRVYNSQKAAQGLTVSGIAGRWLRVRTGGRDGYVFSGFLSKLGAPDLRSSNLRQYALKHFGKTGPEKTVRITRNQTITLQPCRGGITIETLKTVMSGTTFTEEALRVSGISLAEGFLLARALFASGGINDRAMAVSFRKSLKGDKAVIWRDNRGAVAEKKGGYIRISFMEQAN